MVAPPVSTTAPPTPPDDRPPVISTAPPKHFWVQPPITARYSASVTSVVPHRYVVTSGAVPPNCVQSLVHPCSTASYIATLMVSPAHSYACRSQLSVPPANPPDNFTTPPRPPAVLLFPPAVSVRNPPLWLSSVVSPDVSVMLPPCPVSPEPTRRSMSPPVPLVPRVGLLWIRIGIVAELCIMMLPDSLTCSRLSASS